MLRVIASVAALMWMSVIVFAHAPELPALHETVRTLLSRPLPNSAGKTFTSVIVDYPPAARSLPHRHAPSAFIYAYVLDGAIESSVDGQVPKVYRTGDSFIELPGAHHGVSANASQSESARMLVVFVAADGERLTIPDSSY